MKNTLPYLLLISFFHFGSYGQNEKLYITTKISDKYAYIDVVKTYERVAAKGYKSVDLYQKLANSFYKNLEFTKAAKWYCELFTLTTDLDSEYYNRYAQSLICTGQIIEANEVLEKLRQRSAMVFANNDKAITYDYFKNNYYQK